MLTCILFVSLDQPRTYFLKATVVMGVIRLTVTWSYIYHLMIIVFQDHVILVIVVNETVFSFLKYSHLNINHIVRIILWWSSLLTNACQKLFKCCYRNSNIVWNPLRGTEYLYISNCISLYCFHKCIGYLFIFSVFPLKCYSQRLFSSTCESV